MGVFRSVGLVAALALAGCQAPIEGLWRARVGRIPFDLRIEREGAALTASVINGEEEIPVSFFERRGDSGERSWTLDFPHYDSRIDCSLSSDSGQLLGKWFKNRGESIALLDFVAQPIGSSESSASTLVSSELAKRWRVTFSSSSDPAVAIFDTKADGAARGTFLTTTGDYRYLAGRFDGDRLSLSCFDGAHAFSFEAALQADGSLSGEFWSGDWWHETWTAVPDRDAKLPDAFDQTKWRDGVALGDLAFPDLEGKLRRLDDPEFVGKGRVVYVFGSWCPNCHDASRFLGEMWRKYSAKGLSITGLAFELTGDAARDARQVERYRERHEIEYPLLLAGTSDKKEATEQLGALDFVRSYPTTIFIRRDGTVRAIHSGFTGPATGKAYEELKLRFEALILELLADEG